MGVHSIAVKVTSDGEAVPSRRLIAVRGDGGTQSEAFRRLLLTTEDTERAESRCFCVNCPVGDEPFPLLVRGQAHGQW